MLPLRYIVPQDFLFLIQLASIQRVSLTKYKFFSSMLCHPREKCTFCFICLQKLTFFKLRRMTQDCGILSHLLEITIEQSQEIFTSDYFALDGQLFMARISRSFRVSPRHPLRTNFIYLFSWRREAHESKAS